MPNWVFSGVSIKGPEKQVEDIKKQLNQPFTMIQDNYNQETKQWEKKEFSYSNPVFSFCNIHRPIDMDTYNLQEDPNADKNILFSGNNWYDWNNREWGTKWDVGVRDGERYSDTEIREESSGVIYYAFQTAWSPAIPAIQKLSKFVPDCVVGFSYQEENGWGGEMTFLDGQIVQEMEYDSMCNECSTPDKMEYCEECDDEVCLECHYLRGEEICNHLVEA